MQCLIALKFGTKQEHIKKNSGTDLELGVSLISIQCVRSDDSHKELLN